eukprot:m.153725 g.153725  ORF g.153725 m.153725 type:complete len:1082 (+) comp16241_c0_seq1:119-3364(+)
MGTETQATASRVRRTRATSSSTPSLSPAKTPAEKGHRQKARRPPSASSPRPPRSDANSPASSLTLCPHIKSTKHPILRPQTKDAILNPRNWMCSVCGTTDGVWACLHCQSFACGRQQSKHALDHHNHTQHALVIEICSQYVFCYACDEWVTADDSFEDLTHLREQLSTIQNQSAPPSVTRSGRIIRSDNPGSSPLPEPKKLERLDLLDNALRRWRHSMLYSAFLAWRTFVATRKDRADQQSSSSDDEENLEEEMQGEDDSQDDLADVPEAGNDGCGAHHHNSHSNRKASQKTELRAPQHHFRPVQGHATDDFQPGHTSVTPPGTQQSTQDGEDPSSDTTAASMSELGSTTPAAFDNVEQEEQWLKGQMNSTLAQSQTRASSLSSASPPPSSPSSASQVESRGGPARITRSARRHAAVGSSLAAAESEHESDANDDDDENDENEDSVFQSSQAKSHSASPGCRSSRSRKSSPRRRRNSTLQAAVAELLASPKHKRNASANLKQGLTALQRIKPLVEPGMSGLRNLGQTCYMNAVLQVLSHIPIYRLALYDLGKRGLLLLDPASSTQQLASSKTPSPGTKRAELARRLHALERQSTTECFTYLETPLPGMTSYLRSRTRAATKAQNSEKTVQHVSITHLLESLFRVLWSGKWAVLTPHAILGFVWRMAPAFRGYRQQDAQELLLLLEDAINSDLNEIEQNISSVQVSQPAIAILRSALQGTLDTSITCLECQHQSVTRQEFGFLAIDVPLDNTDDEPTSRPLESLLRQFFAPERLDNAYFCDRCSPVSIKRPKLLSSSSRKEGKSRKSMSALKGTGSPSVSSTPTRNLQPKSSGSQKGIATSTPPGSSPDTPPAKRKRGRPRKRPPSVSQSETVQAVMTDSACEKDNHHDKKDHMDAALEPCDEMLAASSQQATLLAPISKPSSEDGDESSRRTALKSSSISTLPAVLKIHIKRFCWRGAVRRKLQDHVECPLVLDMAEFCGADAEVVADARFPETVYDLAAIITHEGKDLNSGHYKCYCNMQGSAQRSDRWILANDTRMRSVNLDEVLATQAYVAFYVHRGVTDYVRDCLHEYPGTPLMPFH